MTCDTQAETDSVYCVLNPTVPGCSNCTSADTAWLNTSVSTCESVYGENNYSIVDTNSTCEHRGHCCPMDSILTDSSCTYRCSQISSTCASKKGRLAVDVLRDTSVTGSDSTFYNKCFYNCSYAYSVDSAEAIVLGNITLAGPNTAISDGTKSPADFASVRSDYSGVYVYDYLSPESYAWLDSLVSTPCATGMYRGIKNGKYVYWKAGQPVPDSVTNVVKIK